MHPAFFQVGIVVGSIQETRAQFARSMGIEFTEPQTIDMHVLFEGAIEPRRIRVCFSKHQLPHLELIEATESPWNIERAGMHHLAVWSDDVEADVAQVLAGGGSIAVRRVTPEGHPAGFVYVRIPGGPLLEILDRRRRPALQETLGTDVLT